MKYDKFNKNDGESQRSDFLQEFEKPRLLLHACCSVCALYVLQILSREYDVTIFYYNPNIFPYEEYVKRRVDLERYTSNLGIDFIEGVYESDKWYSFASFLSEEDEGGLRCDICFNVRLNQVAKFALQNGFQWFATTLTVSPHKNSKLINKIGRALAADYGIDYLQSDFKKNDGFKKTVDMAKTLGFYRQNYCGCSFSMVAADSKKLAKKNLLQVQEALDVKI